MNMQYTSRDSYDGGYKVISVIKENKRQNQPVQTQEKPD